MLMLMSADVYEIMLVSAEPLHFIVISGTEIMPLLQLLNNALVTRNAFI